MTVHTRTVPTIYGCERNCNEPRWRIGPSLKITMTSTVQEITMTSTVSNVICMQISVNKVYIIIPYDRLRMLILNKT